MVVSAIAIPPVNASAPAPRASRSTSRRETSCGCESSARTLFGFLILRLETARRLNKRIITQTEGYWKKGGSIGHAPENLAPGDGLKPVPATPVGFLLDKAVFRLESRLQPAKRPIYRSGKKSFLLYSRWKE